MAKAKKKRADKYEKKLKISGSFEDVVKVSVKPGEKKHLPNDNLKDKE
jgi:hypothetical protein